MTELQKNNKERFGNRRKAFVEFIDGTINNVVILAHYTMGNLPELDNYINFIDNDFNSHYNFRIKRIVSY